MKKLIYIILFLFSFSVLSAQYGDQFPQVINGITCLVHLPDTYNTDPTTQKYPMLIMCQGAGEYGTDPARAAINGVGYTLKVGTWDGKAYNPTTGIQEKFVTISALSATNSAGLSMDQVDQLFTYAIANYRGDTTVKGITGLSRGGGVAWDDAIHVVSYNWGTSPPTPTFKTPKHIPTAIVVASSESNYFDPVDKFVADGTWVWGFGDVLSGDSHAQTTKANMDSVNKYTNPDRARFTSYRCLTTGKFGHCGWNVSVYDSAIKETIDGHSMNIYQFLLYHRKGTVAPPANSIATGSVSTSICVATGGTVISVPVSSVGTYTSNTYTVQLSDKNGLFGSPINIGSKVSNANTDVITATIPFTIPSGTKYRIRVVSNNPAIIGSDNGSDITIKIASNSISPTGTQTISVNTNGTQLTGVEGSVPNSRQWLSNGAVISGQTGTTYLPYFITPGTYQIKLKSFFTCDTVTSNIVTITAVAASPHRIYVNKAADNSVYLNGCNGSFKYNPGDSIILTKAQSPISRISMNCVNNVTIINEDSAYLNDYVNGTSVVPGAIVLTNCSNIHITGTGKAGLKYGITNSSTLGRGFAIEVHGISNFIEIDHIHIVGKNVGVAVKEEQLDNQCYDSLAFPRLVMHDYKIHDNWIHNIINEGMYLGSTAPNSNDTSVNNQHPIVFCPNGDTNRTLTARMGNFQIYNNIIDSTGRGGIQLGSADSGVNLIYGNTVTRSGYNGTYGQGNGIVIGGYTHADIYNNIVRSTTSTGIFILGSGLNRIFNNVIDSSGIKRDGTVITNTPNIAIDTRNTSNPSPGHSNPELSVFQVYDNSVLKKTSNYNIIMYKTYNTFSPTGSYICNSGNVYNFDQVPYSTNCGITPSITMGTIPTSYCVTNSAVDSVIISFTSIGTYNSNNQYIAYISDKNGSFTSPISIGNLSSSGSSGSIHAAIPKALPAGTNYAIKVQSTSPVVSSGITSPITVISATNNIVPATDQNIETNQNGDTITVLEGSAPISRQWYANDSLLTGKTSTFYVPNFPVAGTYVIKCVSIFPCGNVSSNLVTVTVVAPPPPPIQSIVIDALSTSNFCVTATSGADILVTYHAQGTYATNNVYKVQLSNSNGSFNTRTVIGTDTSNGSSGTILARIPPNTPAGTKYKIRVVSLHPVVISNSTTILTIVLATSSISPVSSQTIEQYSSINTLTAIEGSTSTLKQWYVNGLPVSGATSATYTPTFNTVGTYVIGYRSTFSSCGQITSSNSVTVIVNSPIPPPPPDTICVTNHNWQHDSTFEKIDTLIAHVPVATYTTVCDTLHFLFLKFAYNCRLDSVVTYHDSEYYTTSYVVKQTPPHDTTICTSSYKLGAFYFSSNGIVSIANQIDTVHNYLGLNYIRLNITRGGGSSWNVKQANDSGMSVVQTINNSSDGASGFGKYLDSVFDIATPEVVCIKNEEALNATSLSAYLSDLQIAIDTGHAHGVRVANGGITGDVIYSMIDWMQHNGKSDSATTLIQALGLVMGSSEATTAIATYDVLLPAYKDMALDYVNVHGYEPLRGDTSSITTSGLLPIIINYIKIRTGNKPIMTNEMGTRNHSYSLLNDFIREWVSVDARYIIYFDGNGTQAVKNQEYFKQIVSSLSTGNLVAKDEFDYINGAYWSKQAIQPDSIYSTTAFAHSGANDVKFSFNYSDWTDDSALQPQGHRVELKGKGIIPPGQFELDSTYWLGFSVYFPSMWQPDPTNALIWQFHGKSGEDGSPIGAGAGGSPALSANVRPGVDSVSVFVKYDSISPTQDGFLNILKVPLIRNTWMDWVMQIKFSYVNGFVNIWINGVQKTAYVGGTTFHSEGQTSDVGPYFKLGIYKATWGTVPNIGQVSNLTLYYDNLKIGNAFSSYSEVAPK